VNKELLKLSKSELISYIEDISKNWLAIDGTWFLAAEERFGLDTAIELDAASWKRFSPAEARRLKKRFNLPDNGGIPALMKALNFRVYANINEQEIIEVSEKRCVFRMNKCRVQTARNRKGLPDFPCKSVGIIEYEEFAKTIDPRIETKCICCPPDEHPDEYYCAWEFTIKE
jgi:hypothetical protein